MIWVKDSPRALPVASLVAIALFGSVGCSHKAPPPPINAAVVFAKKCGSCHFEGNDLRAPEPTALRNMSRAAILTALQSGRMRWQGKNLSSAEKSAVAEFLGKSDLAVAASLNGVCARDLDPPAHPPEWSGWGVTPTNTRFQSLSSAGLDRGKVKNLKLKWAFGFPGAAATYGQPTSYAGRLYVGSEDGTVYALDAATGCTWWSFRASTTVKTAISIGNVGQTAYFGDTNGYIYAINTSMPERQGREMTEGYRHKPGPYGPLPAYTCPRHQVRTYGVLKDGHLVAYTWLYQMGEMCLFSTILGHGDHLNAGVMYLLIAETLKDIIPVAGTKYAMYNMHQSGTEGLRFFKEQMGFRSYWVNWQLADEPPFTGTPPDVAAAAPKTSQKSAQKPAALTVGRIVRGVGRRARRILERSRPG